MPKFTTKQQYWVEKLKQADAFEGSLSQFAKQQGVSPQTLYRWRNVLQNQELNSAVNSPVQFAKVELPAAQAARSAPSLMVQIGSAQLVFNQLPDTQWLNTLIAVHD